MTDRPKASGPEATQSELTSEELDDISGGMMRNDPTDGSDDGGSGGGATTTTATTTSRATPTDTTMEKLLKATQSYADMLNQVGKLP